MGQYIKSVFDLPSSVTRYVISLMKNNSLKNEIEILLNENVSLMLMALNLKTKIDI